MDIKFEINKDAIRFSFEGVSKTGRYIRGAKELKTYEALPVSCLEDVLAEIKTDIWDAE